ncbi:MAG: DUF4011 domain-containing protein, partial [Cyclobacteriaceae bacterium]|nr:DUF4011 domain-containing protein [Cyclobacteriaceae bacterium]
MNKPSFEIIDHLIAGKKATLCAVLDSRDVDTNVESRRLRKIKRVEKFIFEEQGAKDLYVGWPFVHGKFANGNPVRCALLYFPVDLIEEGGFWHLKPRKSDGITLNKAFFLAYGYHHGIKISDELLDKNLEEFDSDSTVFRSGLYQLLKEYNIEINFNQDTFTDKLIRFTDYKKADYEDITKEGELKLIQEAVLGIFPQSG